MTFATVNGQRCFLLSTARAERLMAADTKEKACKMGVLDRIIDYCNGNEKRDFLSKLYDEMRSGQAQPGGSATEEAAESHRPRTQEEVRLDAFEALRKRVLPEHRHRLKLEVTPSKVHKMTGVDYQFKLDDTEIAKGNFFGRDKYAMKVRYLAGHVETKALEDLQLQDRVKNPENLLENLKTSRVDQSCPQRVMDERIKALDPEVLKELKAQAEEDHLTASDTFLGGAVCSILKTKIQNIDDDGCSEFCLDTEQGEALKECLRSSKLPIYRTTLGELYTKQGSASGPQSSAGSDPRNVARTV